MTSKNPGYGHIRQLNTISSELEVNGYLYLPKYKPSSTTLEIARMIGTVVNIPALIPGSGIPEVQTIQPQSPSITNLNQYSGHYGLDSFPLHSDLAHWAIPPRYLALRCIHGDSMVTTNVLQFSTIESLVGRMLIRKALTVPRKRRSGQAVCLLSIAMRINGQYAFRWDPLFLKPANPAAIKLNEVMRNRNWGTQQIRFVLEQPGDTLVLDNWHVLHGRSSVPTQALSRHIERIYMSELNK